MRHAHTATVQRIAGGYWDAKQSGEFAQLGKFAALFAID